MILYHFTTSPFARRVRLALAHKGLHAELRDARANPEHLAALRELNPFHTVPTLVDGERVLFDSAVICQYLERKVPTPPLWPSAVEGAESFALIALCDGAITTTVDLGMRYAALDDHPQFHAVRDHLLGRVRRGFDALAQKVAAKPTGPLVADAWGAADMALYTLVYWFETMPQRVPFFPPAKKMLALGVELPPALSRWADQHRQRPDVLALD
ncbi:MAG TPA: glutathione S-transferase family protein [Polyangiales bacterium]